MLGRGALCADSMGLGKTLTMLALILATKSDIPVDHSNATLIGASSVCLVEHRSHLEELIQSSLCP